MSSDEEILALRKQGLKFREIAVQLGISEQWASHVYRRVTHGETKRTESKPRHPRLTKRDCLKCGNGFMSEGAHNRICRNCRLSHDWRQGDLAAPYSFGSR